jgi:hypothetical protein
VEESSSGRVVGSRFKGDIFDIDEDLNAACGQILDKRVVRHGVEIRAGHSDGGAEKDVGVSEYLEALEDLGVDSAASPRIGLVLGPFETENGDDVAVFLEVLHEDVIDE